jgi:hypothetical protein
LHVSALGCCDQEETYLQGKIGESSTMDLQLTTQLMTQEGKPDIILKIGGQFIGLQKDIESVINKEISYFSSICPTFKQFVTLNKISVIFSKSPNLGSLVVKTKI